MANFKYNKEFIENMAKEFMELLITHHCADDTAIYFNGERYGSVYKIINDDFIISKMIFYVKHFEQKILNFCFFLYLPSFNTSIILNILIIGIILWILFFQIKRLFT